MAKMIKCPECGEEFKKPFFTQKHHGYGVTFGALGDVTCPKCGHKARVGLFLSQKNGEWV
jgi:uncharacterized protein (UPF0212 family)